MERLKPHSLPSKPAIPTDPEAASTGTANESEGKDRAREASSEGSERSCGLGRALNVGEVVDVERLSGGHDYGKHDHSGERHTGKNIETTHPLYFSRPATTQPFEWYGLSAAFGCVAHLFDPVSTLPEKELGRDRCAEHRDQKC